MPFNPSVRDVHINSLLSNLSIAFIQEESQFVAGRVTKPIPVNHQSDLFLTYDQNDWFQDEAEIRAPATESQGSGFGTGDLKYFCQEYAFHKDIPDEVVDNADDPVQVELASTEFVTQKLLLKQDVVLGDKIFKTGVWTNDDAGASTKWDDYAFSTPIKDVDITAKEAIHSITGKDARTMVLARAVHKQLKHHPSILERLKYTQKGIITIDLIQAVMDLDSYVVAEAIKATNIPGATAAYAPIFGKNALLMFIAPTPGLMTVSAYVSFVWTKLGLQSRIRRLRDDWANFTRIEGKFNIDHQVIAPDLGYFFDSIVS